MYDYHHVTFCVISVLLTNVSNQAPQPPQTSHSPHHHGPIPIPTPGSRPETFHCPRNSSPHPIVDTHLILPGAPSEIPYPIFQGAIERGEHHNHGERNIVRSNSPNIRAHQNPFTILQVFRSPSSLSLGSYFQAPYGLETAPPSLPIPAPSLIDSIIRSIPRSETVRGLS